MRPVEPLACLGKLNEAIDTQRSQLLNLASQ
jgi:hypothetical protein